MTNMMTTLEIRKKELSSLLDEKNEKERLSEQLKDCINEVSQCNNKLAEVNIV